MYQGPEAKLSSTAFLKNLGLMMYALEDLNDLSEALKSRDIILSQSVNLIKRQLDAQYHEQEPRQWLILQNCM